MRNIWDTLMEDPYTAIATLICATILGCVLVFGGVSCVKAEYEYKIKRQELQNQGSKEFFNKER